MFRLHSTGTNAYIHKLFNIIRKIMPKYLGLLFLGAVTFQAEAAEAPRK